MYADWFRYNHFAQVIVQLLAVAAGSSIVNIAAGALVLQQLASMDLSGALVETLLALGHSVTGQASACKTAASGNFLVGGIVM